MDMAADITRVMADFGSWCDVRGRDEGAARPVFMVVYTVGTGSINNRDNLLSFVDKRTLPQGANWGYGLLMDADAPPDMAEESRLTIRDVDDAVWECESAKPIYGIVDKRKQRIAWRLLLRGKQRLARGK